MAYAVNGFVRKNLHNKVTVMFIIDDVDNMFKNVKHDEGFVMTHIESAGGKPVFYLNGEQASASEWSVIAGTKEKEDAGLDVSKEDIKYFEKRFFGLKLNQIQTMHIWICKKVKDLFLNGTTNAY